MAGATTCAYRSLQLSPGEQFVLPPGAELIGATDPDSIQSLCADTDALEEMQCYVAMLATVPGDTNNDYYDCVNQHLEGYELNGVFTPFTPHFSNDQLACRFNSQAILNKLKELLPAVVATSYAWAGDSDGEKNYLVIKTIPSIGSNLVFRWSTEAAVSGQMSTVLFKANFIKVSDAIAAGHEFIPDCPEGIISV